MIPKPVYQCALYGFQVSRVRTKDGKGTEERWTAQLRLLEQHRTHAGLTPDTMIRTSPVLKVDFERCELETENSIYRWQGVVAPDSQSRLA